MKNLLFFLLMPLVGFSQTLYQGQGNSSDDNPPGLEEAWKYKYARQDSFRSPYGNLESEIPESYGNSPSRMTVNGKSHATKCRPKKYRQTFELPPEAFADFCEAKMGKSYKEEKEKAANKHYMQMIQKFYGQQVKKRRSIQKTYGGMRPSHDIKKYIVNTVSDLAGALKAAEQGKEIHDHRNGQKGCYKCHSDRNAAKKLKKKIKYRSNNIPTQKIGSSKRYSTRRLIRPRSRKLVRGPSRVRKGRVSRKPTSFRSSRRGSLSGTYRKPDLGYSYSQSRGSSVLINYQPNRNNKGMTGYEWGTQNK